MHLAISQFLGPTDFYSMVFVDTSFGTAPQFTVVEYFAKACPHCVHMAPVWESAANAAQSAPNAENVAWVQKECYGDNWAPGKDFDACKNRQR